MPTKLLPAAAFSLALSGIVAAAKPLDTVPMDPSRAGPAIEISINGTGPYRFIIDPSREGSMIDPGLADELELVAGTTGEIRIGSVTIGEFEFANVVAERWEGPRYDGRARGVLGLGVFNDHLLTLDFPREQLRLQSEPLSSADGREILAYTRGDEGAPTIPIRVAGIDMKATLNIGPLGGVTMPATFAERLPLTADPAMIGRARTQDGTAEILGSSLKGVLDVGHHSVDGPGVFFSDAFSHVAIGSDVFGRFVVSIDQKSRRIRFRVAEPRKNRLFARAAGVRRLSGKGTDLKTAFNEDSEQVRLVLILSPT